MALAHFQRTFTDAAGNIKPGLAVTVRRESDNGLAALFADAGSVTAKSNPFNTDANGYGSFYVTDGRYRIQATDIDWRNEDLISQPSPNFTAMPQVGGDPIVESGSNADGEWTRWSDGTQITSQQFLLGGTIGNIVNGFYVINQNIENFSVSFLSTPKLSISVANNLTNTFYSIVASDNGNNPTTSTSTGRIRGLVTEPTGALGVDVIAYGRWK
jgi:hypothetical protein